MRKTNLVVLAGAVTVIRHILSALVLFGFNCHLHAEEASLLGIVKEKPKTGRFVRLPEGYMVPYKVTIPTSGISFWMEPIPGGEFIMGSPAGEKGRSKLEGPQHKVRVEPFWMGRTEVTQGEYRNYMALYSIFRDQSFEHLTEVTDENKSDAVSAPTVIYEPEFVFEFGDHVHQPITTVSQYAAKQYTKWLSLTVGNDYRLPTEAEWEYACRAGSTTAWHFGEDPKLLSIYAWYRGNSWDEGFRKVATKKPNNWGLYDMHGNAAEWVLDYCEQYKTSDQPSVAHRDWFRALKLAPVSVRGGSWGSRQRACRSATRLPSDMDKWRDYDPDLPRSPWWLASDFARQVGFRIMRPLKPMTAEEKQECWQPLDEQTQFDIEDLIREGRGAWGIPSAQLLKDAARKEAERLEGTRQQQK